MNRIKEDLERKRSNRRGNIRRLLHYKPSMAEGATQIYREREKEKGR